jgi:hypothetical protein
METQRVASTASNCTHRSLGADRGAAAVDACRVVKKLVVLLRACAASEIAGRFMAATPSCHEHVCMPNHTNLWCAVSTSVRYRNNRLRCSPHRQLSYLGQDVRWHLRCRDLASLRAGCGRLLLAFPSSVTAVGSHNHHPSALTTSTL